MSFTTTQQINKLLEDKKNILITFRKNSTDDTIASAMALFLFLEKYNKQTDIVCDSFKLPDNLNFLKKSEQIKGEFPGLQKFTMTIDIEKTGVKELSYDTKEKKLRIFITPKQGYLSKNDIRTAQSDFKYDLIITLGTPDLESIGSIYNNNTDLFYKTPIINIDNQPNNEHFGQINVVNLTASSTSEVLFELLKKLGEEYINEDIATALLTGIISETKSFKSDSVKPHTLEIASKLIGMGANREKIISKLYRTRTISMLKLWGQALTHLQSDKDYGLIWSTITREDFIRCGAKESDLRDIISELINNSPDAKITLLLHEHSEEKTIHGLLNTNKNYDVRELIKEYNPSGTRKNASFIIKGRNLQTVEEEIINHLKKSIAEIPS